MKYNKLIRDKIPEIIEKSGSKPIVRTASEKEYWEKLVEKLIEESKEFLEKPTEEELADILEVINAIIEHKFDKNKVEEIRKKKLEERGGFEKRLILEETC